MHIPDNYLAPVFCIGMNVAMLPVWSKSLKTVKTLTKEKLPLMGIGASLSFLTMMFNIPLPGGTTGHAIGATLLAILLGPEAACISISIALLIQAVLFGDGGILAYGANCFNIAFIAPFLGYFIYKFLKNIIKSHKGEYISAAIAAYVSLNIAALFTAIEFGVQPLLFKDAFGVPLYCPYPMSVTIPAMLIPHIIVAGIVESIATIGVLAFIKKASHEVMQDTSKRKFNSIYILLTVLICLTPIGLFATGTAWGEWSSEEISNVITNGKVLGFTPKGMENGLNIRTFIADYSISGIPEQVAYALSALIGVSILLIIFKLIGSSKKNSYSYNEEFSKKL